MMILYIDLGLINQNPLLKMCLQIRAKSKTKRNNMFRITFLSMSFATELLAVWREISRLVIYFLNIKWFLQLKNKMCSISTWYNTIYTWIQKKRKRKLGLPVILNIITFEHTWNKHVNITFKYERNTLLIIPVSITF